MWTGSVDTSGHTHVNADAPGLHMWHFSRRESHSDLTGCEHAQDKPASRFANNRDQRRRESAGCQVGQALILATAQDTFSQARPPATLVHH